MGMPFTHPIHIPSLSQISTREQFWVNQAHIHDKDSGSEGEEEDGPLTCINARSPTCSVFVVILFLTS